MKKFIFAFFVVFILIISFVLGATRNEDFSESLSQKSLEKSLRANGEVRVIIKFNNPEEKNAFNSAKKDIQTVIGKNKIKHDFGDSITLDVNSKDLENLKKNKNIESITLIPSKKLFLQDSVPLINATLAWNLQVNGFNLTGSGETVCIIDTGVNYTHLDLGGCFGNNNVSSNCKIIGGWNTLADNNNTMDVQGHGTHVSGIVAANGTINGVAKNAKIIMMMAYNSSAAVFYDDDLKEAIDWCVSNSSVFNISVISMSLGGGSYSSSCDYQDDPLNLTDSIHSATAKNISVVVATGNDYSTTDIASPSCVSGVIPVGSTDKSDVISTFSNTNSLVKLLAPGENINSTCITGGYCLMSGTSMATPHVAGAILLINQYLRQLGQVKTPADIEILLNNTGKRVEDLGFSNLNFSRINVYLAILNLTRNPPLVRLLSPSNNLFSSINNWNFSCSNSGLNLTNTTFYLWNSTALIYNETKNSSGTFNTTVFNYTFNNETSYYWNCRGSNNNSIYSFASTNNTLTYDITAPSINLTSPSDGYAETASSSTLTFNYNVTDANNISNCSLIVNGAVNTVNLTINPSSITSTFVPGNYNWSVNCSDNSGNIGNSSNRSFTITAPVAVCTNCGGGGGGGSSTHTYVLNENQITKGYTQIIAAEDKIKFSAGGNGVYLKENHTITISSVTNSYVSLVISSNPINVTLLIGEERKLSLDNPGYYDILIKLNSILNNKANFTVKAIYEKIPIINSSSSKQSNQVFNNETSQEIKINTLENAKIYIWGFVIVSIVIIVAIFIKVTGKIPPKKIVEDKSKIIKTKRKLKNSNVSLGSRRRVF